MTHHAESPGSVPILAAARRRFLQWGFSGTSMAALAEDLGMTKAALYYHFPDKETLFLAVVKQYLTEVAADLVPLAPLFAESSAQAALEGLAEVFLSRHGTSAQMQQLAFQESRHLTVEGQKVLSTTYHDSMVRPLAALLSQATDRGWIRRTTEDEPASLWIFLGLLTAFLRPGHGNAPGPRASSATFVRLFTSTLKGDSAC